MEKFKKILNGLWSILEVIIILYVIVMTAFILFKNKYGYTQVNNYTFYNVDKIGEVNNSRLTKGDLVVIKGTDDIKVGDMIYYYAIYNESYIVRSDTVKDITKSGKDTMYVVHRDGGDTTVFASKVLGKKGVLYPHMGTVLTIVCSRIGFFLLVLLPISIVFIYQVYDFIKLIRKERAEKTDDSEDLDDDSNEDKGEEKEETKDIENEEDKETDTNEDEPVIIATEETTEESNTEDNTAEDDVEKESEKNLKDETEKEETEEAKEVKKDDKKKNTKKKTKDKIIDDDVL